MTIEAIVRLEQTNANTHADLRDGHFNESAREIAKLIIRLQQASIDMNLEDTIEAVVDSVNLEVERQVASMDE